MVKPQPTRWRVLLLAALVAAVAGWAVSVSYSSVLPVLPWTMVPTLLLLGAAELAGARNLRARIQRKPGAEPVDPISAARYLALAKASALLGAVLAGGFAGYTLPMLERLHAESMRNDAVVGGATALSAAALVVCAIVLEYACRVPEDPDEKNGPGRSRA
ncbi:DUF3180 domain-containing protein [Allonocardiopsis opalescens]|uniref:Uncharacterized protein DUF3180 n=1 Tax=Allonocardiopsis opalescens TaxID=1144618 RepID=A0A2T0Q240_9ACTN|nr:DUF3180 domain-containing protein [Allonocardiopsis opalescens]PRX97841.1 uncharacterized protein DUF3180 [Allonocardiopsis opalescens]